MAVSAAHGAHPVRIQQVMAGANGDSSISFIELEFAYGTVPKWGPQGSETQSRAVLTFHDATGARVDTFAFPSDPPVGPLDPADQSHSVLIASQAFVEYTGLPADYVIAASPRAVDGMVCFTENPLNPGLDVNLCLSYGNYQGPTESDGCAPEVENGPPTQPLVIAFLLPVALGRISSSGPGEAFGCGQVNADFALRPAQPRNSAGDTATLPALSRVDQGRSLFARETFGGNGRTCASCHRPDDRFALSPEAIAELFATDPSDPLFVAEHDPALGELENACLMRMGHQRGLILENIDGFDRSPVFRGSPHLLNVGFTAPYGQSEGFADLRSFSISAIEQHLPKSLARNSDPAAGPVDFRVPRDFELEALEAYMNSLRFPADGDTSIDRMLDLAQRMGMDRAAIDRGRALVTGTAGRAQCVLCHSGPVLAQADGRLGLGTGNVAFDIGVAFRSENADDGCAGGPGDPSPALPPEFRRFSTPPLFGVANTAPYFHDGSAATLRDAVAHYGETFGLSEAKFIMEVSGFVIALSEQEIDDIVAFLEAISVDPSGVPPDCGDGAVDADEECDDGNLDGGDGCSVQCRKEQAFLCTGEPSLCELACDSLEARVCDLNGDGFVDRVDIDLLFAAAGSATTDTCDPRDRDGDGEISLLDGRLCAIRCDNAGCEPTPVCGLLGAEFLPLAALALRHRRRRTHHTAQPPNGTCAE